MATIYDVNTNELIEKAAEELKKSKDIQKPDWAIFVKTGMHKERPPNDPNWWFMRAAAVLRKVYITGPIGVSKLRTQFGGKKGRGSKREHFYKGSGKIARLILQQLEKEGLVKYVEKGVHKGRIITPKGKSFLDKIIKAKAAK
ncbi:MAG: 30S ribosomal protein S19e [Nanoarchaeota archaeon]